MKSIAILCLLIATPASAYSQVGLAMSQEEIEDLYSGNELSGCYFEGTPFSELTTEDGLVYDTLGTSTHVGEWKAQGRSVCFKYSKVDPPESDFACAQVLKTETGYFLFHNAAGRVVAWMDEAKCQSLKSINRDRF